MPTTNHPQEPPPSPRQHAYLRGLAERAGESFTPPATRREASAEIHRLKQRLARRTPDERWRACQDARRDREHISEKLTSGGYYAPAFRPSETRGHGSTAHWTPGA